MPASALKVTVGKESSNERNMTQTKISVMSTTIRHVWDPQDISKRNGKGKWVDEANLRSYLGWGGGKVCMTDRKGIDRKQVGMVQSAGYHHEPQLCTSRIFL